MGLAAAHEQGLVHRDFKPSNAMLDGKGRARVLDFGLARESESSEDDDPPTGQTQTKPPSDTSLTRTGAILGTPAYMPPEQMLGREADARSDQFSFCVLADPVPRPPEDPAVPRLNGRKDRGPRPPRCPPPTPGRPPGPPPAWRRLEAVDRAWSSVESVTRRQAA